MSRRHRITAAERREYERDWSRLRRYRRWLTVNDGQTHCQWRMGRYRCGGELTRTADGELRCLWCVLKHWRICRDCLVEIDGGPNAIRCKDCREDAARGHSQRSERKHRDKRRAADRARTARWRAEGHPSYQRKLISRKAWRLLNPGKVAEYKAAERERKNAHRDAYHAERRRRLRLEKRAIEKQRRDGTLPPRTCVTCTTILQGGAKKCAPCKARAATVALHVMGQLVQSKGVPTIHGGEWPVYAMFRGSENPHKTRVNPPNFPSASHDFQSRDADTM